MSAGTSSKQYRGMCDCIESYQGDPTNSTKKRRRSKTFGINSLKHNRGFDGKTEPTEKGPD